jgi:hypothetical protein
MCYIALRRDCTTSAYQPPGGEVHGGALSVGRVRQMQVQRLTLIDESPTVGSHFENCLPRYFPRSFVKVLDVLRNTRDALDGAAGGNQLIL